MVRKLALGLSAAAITVLAVVGSAAAQTSATYAAVVADSHRPAGDTARDADRKPAEMLAFAGVKPGETVYEVLPGGGYFTRLLSRAVGPNGHVYAAAPPGKFQEAAAAIAADPAYANVSVVGMDVAAVSPLPQFDLIWTSQNYHDLHLTRVHQDPVLIDKLWLSKLKPGGELIVIDHVAAAGSPVVKTADDLHRIDPAAARSEIESAGFVFDGKSDALANPADPHTANVFDPSIRGKTDQFTYRFKKPV
jgi:predicted methyltransferase